MAALTAYLESRQLTPVVGRTFHLSSAGEAIRYLADGEPIGRVVPTLDDTRTAPAEAAGP